MKNLLFLSLLFIGFASCKKEDEAKTTYSYRIEGIKDLSLVRGSHNGSATPALGLKVIYDNGVNEQVALSLENIPAGLSYKIDSAAGMPNFNSKISFADSGVVEGNFVIKLVATGHTTGRHEFSFNIVVGSIPDCTAEVIGNNFVTSSPCSPSANYMQNVTLENSATNRVLFSNIGNVSTKVYANVDCEVGGLIIPKQVINGIAYTGEGGYANTGGQRIISITIRKTSATGGVNTCTYRLVK